ncbi:Inhibitor of nuclear factor kappa-B kinase subunit beta [Cordyceps militaris]|uniref:Inhibitor of nuclear factor kappa-B kinase subunit beta n=1 Tax=Cordyceps militaris TaxID=73501 RepID=A0A2H4SE43_CORMI|nr:Inhibitor of nuclear factor kappa-B kinase subunit beta [Cordyceps militaris]
MEADPDIIARIYAHKKYSAASVNAIESSKHYVTPPTQAPPPTPRPCDSRAASVEPTGPLVQGPNEHGSFVELRFSKPPTLSFGFTFGRSSNSDVQLPNDESHKGLSNCHFCITFDDSGRLIVRDLGSIAGTMVTYDEAAKELRRNFRWIISGNAVQEFKKIVVTLFGPIQFRIVLPPTTPTGNRAIKRLEVNNSDTRRPTNVPSRNSPENGCLFVEKKVGQGSFGTVTRFWNVSTGELHVVKKPRAGRPINWVYWRREIENLQLASRENHAHIVKFLGAKTDPYPEISLEYVAGGTLGHYKHITTVQRWMILLQALSALQYLHELQPPIAHRDIKRANILVHAYGENNIHIKLTDFGLSKGDVDLATPCGTSQYNAPELFAIRFNRLTGNQFPQSYTPKADIWSLGVVVFEYACALPSFHEQYRWQADQWGMLILSGFRNHLQHRTELEDFMLDHMIVMDPYQRAEAGLCLRMASRLAPAEALNTIVPSGQPIIDPHRHAAPEVGQETILPGRHSSVEAAAPLTVLHNPRANENHNPRANENHNLRANENHNLPPRKRRRITLLPADYATIHVNTKVVHLNLERRFIHGTQLMAAYNISYGRLRAFLDHKDTNIRDETIRKGANLSAQGLYVPYDGIQAICERFGTDPAPILQEVRAVSRVPADVAPNHEAAVPSFAPAAKSAQDASGEAVDLAVTPKPGTGPPAAPASVLGERNSQPNGQARDEAAGSFFEAAFQIGSDREPVGRSPGELLGNFERSQGPSRTNNNYRYG